MTPDAAHLFTGMHIGNGPHGLNGHPLFVQQLKVDGLSYRRLAENTAVRLDRDYAQWYAAYGFIGVTDQFCFRHVDSD